MEFFGRSHEDMTAYLVDAFLDGFTQEVCLRFEFEVAQSYTGAIHLGIHQLWRQRQGHVRIRDY